MADREFVGYVIKDDFVTGYGQYFSNENFGRQPDSICTGEKAEAKLFETYDEAKRELDKLEPIYGPYSILRRYAKPKPAEQWVIRRKNVHKYASKEEAEREGRRMFGGDFFVELAK